jgi:signal-transduction protein with cAMP-binding, CBS, and nucleotidyltransferase domain|tara:strand:- start:193 stop:579 length:387 start_codon:yes stop_codon:yes gene_type:complete
MVDVQSLLTVKDLIKDEPVFVKFDSTVLAVAKKMKKNKVDNMLVKGSSGNVEGIVTNLDIVYKIVAKDASPSKTEVKEIMTKNLLSIDGNESMFMARQMMLDNKVSHLVVTNNEKQIGIVTSKEVLGK